jgi:hypothetical protein
MGDIAWWWELYARRGAGLGPGRKTRERERGEAKEAVEAVKEAVEEAVEEAVTEAMTLGCYESHQLPMQRRGRKRRRKRRRRTWILTSRIGLWRICWYRWTLWILIDPTL